ncbi:hypothetical protein TOPH_06412 [Tolypocladium ophioglossoides CBS 100239]|uniref:N-acetyltransferase domain-containing protein n=1 Tax=Tolypocladium ophioglossoides (strain CBS 100239) TaxID=1163406 RepID=A0A0L0N4K4_TOLOC|nr:hypothetical protein TOPH_06412 [Tolypocladium ophioglossoides CBS 100239]
MRHCNVRGFNPGITVRNSRSNCTLVPSIGCPDMTLCLRLATEADLGAIAAVSAAAFHPTTDAIARRLFPPHLQPPDVQDGDAARPWRLTRKTSNLDAKRTVMMVVVDEALEGAIVGFSVWEAPVRGEEDEEETNLPEKPCAALDHVALAEMRRLVVEDAKRRFGERESKDVWHLGYIGVDPQNHRRGIGKMLLDWGLKQGVNEGIDCYLVATPAGRPFYQAAGFDVVESFPIFGVPHYSMVMRNSPT